MSIKAAGDKGKVVTLSGGNQQKVVLGKWLSMRPKVIIFDEPTRGVDVGAKSEIYTLMRDLADSGVAILMISSDMEEVIGVSDRIAVMHEVRSAASCNVRSSANTTSSASPSARNSIDASKKELGLLLLLVVISGITEALNPRFLSGVNLLDMANLIGLFGIFSIGEGLTIITGGIDLSVGSMFSLLGVIFIYLVANRDTGWPLALLAVLFGGLVLGGSRAFWITKVRMQPFIVTLCGLLIYRGAARYYTDDSTMGFGYGNDAEH